MKSKKSDTHEQPTLKDDAFKSNDGICQLLSENVANLMNGKISTKDARKITNAADKRLTEMDKRLKKLKTSGEASLTKEELNELNQFFE